MGTDERLATELSSVWQTALASQATVAELRAETLVPKALSAGPHAERVLDALVDGARGAHDTLALERTLGEGGMGVVWLGTQRSLGRKVAIKALRPENRSVGATVNLLREARTMGRLEHPNVLPIHDVVLGEDGEPLIVLKRIDGVDWGELLLDHEALCERFGPGDALEHNLAVFVQLCRAVAFAHRCGIVHRDLKPENVMIGRFGEVYLCDFGIAVSVRDDDDSHDCAKARDAKELAGTPAYMAPEMLGGAAPISERTDIYLLGAILHEIVGGRPPHTGASAVEIVQSILRSSPALDDDAPAELAALVCRCLQSAPEDRPASADEVRLAVAEYLRHRGASALVADAERRLEELTGVLAAACGVERDERAYRLFGECRFGFRAALDAWHECAPARAGLRRSYVLVIEHELAAGDASAAAHLLNECDDPPAELAERVRQAVAAQKRERERLAELEAAQRDQDPHVGQRTRAFVAMLAFLLFSVALLPFGFFPAMTNHWHWLLGIAAVVTVTSGGLVYWARDSLRKTALNRAMVQTLGITIVVTTFLVVMLALARVPLLQRAGWLYGSWLSIMATTTVMTERRFAPSVVVFAIGAAVVAVRPDWAAFTASAACLCIGINIGVVWKPRAGWLKRDPASRR